MTHLAAVMACLLAWHQPPAPPPPAPGDVPMVGETAASRWAEDIDEALRTLLEKHPDPTRRHSRAEFEAFAAALKARAAAGAAGEEIAVGMLELCAMVGDSHTMAGIGSAKVPIRGLAIDFYWAKDGVFVSAIPGEHADLLGGKVLAIGGVALDEALVRLRRVVSADNDAWFRHRFRQFARLHSVLHALDLAGKDSATFMIEPPGGGEAHEVTLAALPPDAKPEWKVAVDLSGDSVAPTLRPRPSQWTYGHSFDERLREMYVWYDVCQDQRGRPRVAQWTQQLLTDIDEKKPAYLIVDLRRNGGGNSTLLMPLVEGIAKRESMNQTGRLYVLIGRATFSSALFNAYHFKDGTRATLVGEPTGGKPTSFGEIKTLPLKNSGLMIQCSTKLHKRGNSDAPSLMPDVLAEPTWSEFSAGRDLAMEAVRANRGAAGEGR